jgi:hypothetical protein
MSEVNQAAERLRRYYSEDELTAEQLYGVSCLERADELWHEDNARLAQAYLDEHAADDDEPITEEWIKKSYSRIDGTANEYEIARCKNGSNAIIRMTNPPSVFVSQFWLCTTTRGQLRRLLEALQ